MQIIDWTNELFVSLQGDAVEAESDAVPSSQLDPKNMKVVELRAALEARNLPSKGEIRVAERKRSVCNESTRSQV